MNIISLNNGKKLNIDKKEIYRYLGYHFGGEVPIDDELEKMVTELTGKVKEVITPRCAYEMYGLYVKEDTCSLNRYSRNDFSQTSIDAKENRDDSSEPLLIIKSSKLSAHIKECRYAILFAATIGPGADMLIRRYSGRSTIKPAILQAVGAAAIEAFADDMTLQIFKEIVNSRSGIIFPSSTDELRNASSISDKTIDYDLLADNISDPVIKSVLKMRFSPGYGDFSLNHQRDFFRLLNLEKNLGMSLNSALLMSPSKSITAVIGVL